ncbi:thrombin-like enzyme agkihpin-1 [Convolutriloba macropyga]|uniref:thrombin-like enzyme agkihpin-1 n=1 Tax=Convolutriloba macropyga TaxID=536237 RepID=UPI003F526340
MIFSLLLSLFLLYVEDTQCKMYLSDGQKFSQLHQSSFISQNPKFASSIITSIINGTDVPSLPFYARLIFLDAGKRLPFFCGGTIIGQNWIVTAAKCVSHIEHGDAFEWYRISVEVSVNSENWVPNEDRRFRVAEFFRAPNHNYTLNREDIVLLKLAAKNRFMPKFRIIPLCTEGVDHGTILGTCGLGSISRQDLILPTGLKEARLKASKFRYDGLLDLDFCPVDQICTFPAQFGSDTNICYMDEGNPLYKFDCSTGLPVCVIGVASHYNVHLNHVNDMCTGGSYFASVPYLLNWIRTTIEANS